ncbi:hypothetical protein T439DRAFT_162359 [Meredithblackwellia eburnea MCA 4105]
MGKVKESSDDEYELEQVASHRLRDSRLQYLVAWVGYKTKTWIAAGNAEGASSLVDEYWATVSPENRLPAKLHYSDEPVKSENDVKRRKSARHSSVDLEQEDVAESRPTKGKAQDKAVQERSPSLSVEPASAPKRGRGRPSKADIEAREAALKSSKTVKSKVAPSEPISPPKTTVVGKSSVSSSPKKRGRPPKVNKSLPKTTESHKHNDAAVQRKRGRDSSPAVEPVPGSSKPKLKDTATKDTAPDKKRRKLDDEESWEDRIKEVDSLAKVNGRLVVNVTWENGEQINDISTDVARKRFPLKLLDYYESKIKFVDDDEGGLEDAA